MTCLLPGFDIGIDLSFDGNLCLLKVGTSIFIWDTIFCERVKGIFKLRRGFNIKKKNKVLIIEDVITTGKSSLECLKLIKKAGAKVIGYACIIDRSNKKTLKIKHKIVSHMKIEVPTFIKNKLPSKLKSIPISKPGSRHVKWKD